MAKSKLYRRKCYVTDDPIQPKRVWTQWVTCLIDQEDYRLSIDRGSWCWKQNRKWPDKRDKDAIFVHGLGGLEVEQVRTQDDEPVFVITRVPFARLYPVISPAVTDDEEDIRDIIRNLGKK